MLMKGDFLTKCYHLLRSEGVSIMDKMKSMLQDYMKDPEFAKAFFIEELTLAVTEAVCEVLNTYGFKQKISDEE